MLHTWPIIGLIFGFRCCSMDICAPIDYAMKAPLNSQFNTEKEITLITQLSEQKYGQIGASALS